MVSTNSRRNDCIARLQSVLDFVDVVSAGAVTGAVACEVNVRGSCAVLAPGFGPNSCFFVEFGDKGRPVELRFGP